MPDPNTEGSFRDDLHGCRPRQAAGGGCGSPEAARRDLVIDISDYLNDIGVVRAKL